MPLHKILKDTEGVVVDEDGTRRSFKARRDLIFDDIHTSGPFEGYYIFERGPYVFYVAHKHVSIEPELTGSS